RNWNRTTQWTEGKRPEVGYGKEFMAKYDINELTSKPTADKAVIEAFFTTKGDTLYVITPRWPGEKLVMKDIEVSPNTVVTMLGVAQSIRWDRSGSDLTIHVPAMSVDDVPCRYAYVFKVTGVR
ncbi:MAG TPA: alpha-L-fucosidase C-terminal domain-containing protein, partial [Sedimentisphaerales bacterium]|nr:alpha-L-fucosidase C-terminal domain-containing protein [Sedimentisphaerales bacterium]